MGPCPASAKNISQKENKHCIILLCNATKNFTECLPAFFTIREAISHIKINEN
jgi:hypothetical protein